MKKENDNLVSEGKKPEEMSSAELETFLQTVPKSHEATPLNPDGTPQEEKKPEETAKEEPKEKKEPPKKEELIAGKFKTQDELIKAYKESEKKISLQGEESSRAKKQADLYRQQISQIYNLDEEGNIVGPKQPTVPSNQDQLAGIRDYFPGYSDEQITALIGLNGLMINSALNKFKQEFDKNLESVYEIKFEREVERQKKQIRDKYSDGVATFSALESEVDEKLKALPASLRAKDGSVETIFLTVRGEKLPQFTEEAVQGALKDKKKREDKSEDAFVETTGKTHVPTPPPDIGKMSSDELEKFINQVKVK